MAAATLLDLPAELIGEIAFYLIENDAGTYISNLYGLYALRLTCRTLHSKTLFGFTKAAFSTLFVDLSLQSLDRLYAISQHEEFRKAITCIYFAHDMSHPIRLDQGNDDVNTSLEEEVQYIVKKGLGRILSSLINLSKIIIVTPFAAPFQTSRSAVDGLLDSPTRQIRANNEESIYGRDRYIVTANQLYLFILEAGSGGGSQLESLDVQGSRAWLDRGRHLKGAFAVCVHSLIQQYRLLQHVRQLRLSLDPGENGCDCFPSGRPITENEMDAENALHRTLQNLPQLTLLRISFTQTFPKDIPRRVKIIRSFATLHLPHLTSFGLLRVPAEEQTLIEFLSRHKDQLQTFQLREVELISGNHWRSILRWLLNHHTHKLRELEIQDNRCQYRVCLESPNIAKGLYKALC